MNDNINTQFSPERPIKKPGKKNIQFSRIKRKVLSHVILVRIALIFSVIAAVFIFGYLLLNFLKKANASIYANSLINFITTPVDQLASSDGKTNILLMGKAGGVHDGPDLTDTIIIMSVSLDKDRVNIISVPRDLWIPEIRAKINSAYYWGSQKEVGGIDFAKAEVSGVFGIPIHYGGVINFDGFKDVIDQLGGIEVDVEREFTDSLYPIAGRENDLCGGNDMYYRCRYEILHFVQGRQLMDGERALKFVRSRHADGVEGTDIARVARQQKVIEGVKNKLVDKNTYRDIKKSREILRVIVNSIQTDMDYPVAAIFARKLYDSRNAINSYLVPSELLTTPPISTKYDMQSVFIPKLGNGRWEEIQTWLKSIY